MLFLSSLTLLAGFATPAIVEAQEEEAVEISFMIPDWGVPTDESLAAFTEETGITVNVIPTSWDDIRDRIATAAVGQEAVADVYEVDWSWTGEFVAANWLAPIDVDEETVADMPTLSTFMVDDQYYALPYANDFRVAYNNERMFSEAGIEELPTNWNTLLDNLRTIKEAGVVDYPISIPLGADENASTTFYWIAFSRNGVVFNDDNTINRDSLVDALTLIDTLVTEDLINPSNTQISGMEAYGQIATGDTAYMVGPSSFLTRVDDEENSTVVGEVAATKLPTIDGDYAEVTVPYNEAVGISPYSENPEAALEFVKWYTDTDTQIEFNQTISAMPTRTSALEEVVDNEEFLEIFSLAQSPFPNGIPDYYTEMSTAIFNGINQLATGQISVEEAANQIEQAVNELAESNN